MVGDALRIVDNKSQQSKHATVITTRVGYKPEDYDITGEDLCKIFARN